MRPLHKWLFRCTLICTVWGAGWCVYGLGWCVQAAFLPRLSDCADVHCTLALHTITGLGPLPAFAERSVTVPLINAQLQLMLYLWNVELYNLYTLLLMQLVCMQQSCLAATVKVVTGSATGSPSAPCTIHTLSLPMTACYVLPTWAVPAVR
jgi:hypothetical protein